MGAYDDMSVDCPPDEYFRCPNGFCVSKELTCDGNPDCPGGSDETIPCGE